MTKVTHFTAKMFTPTEHTTAQEKAEWANRLGTFILGGFQAGNFTNLIYTRLSQCFGHIAHFNREGFYGVWFASPAKQAEFIKYTLDYKVVGQAKYTFSDVCIAFQEWLREQNVQVKVEAKAANERAYIALEDTADHALSLLTGGKTAEGVGSVVDECVAFITKFLPSKLDSDRINDLKRKMIRKYTVNAVKFRLADLSHEVNSFGHHGHIFMAEDGEVWSATKSRTHGGVPLCGEIVVPLEDGVPAWGSLGYEIPERLKKATPDQLATTWGD